MVNRDGRISFELIRVLMVPLTTLILLLALLLSGIFYSFPSNVVDQRDGSTGRWFFSQLLPESWAFFTKPPDSPEFSVFKIDHDGINSALLFPHSRKENLYGISRKQRAQGPEMANLAAQVKKEQWTNCEELEVDCVSHVHNEGKKVSVENPAPSPSLCGEVIVAETVPVPWSYRESYDGWRLDRKAVLIESKCG